MSNKDYCDWLPAYAAGDLDRQKMIQFQSHLTQCQQCSEAWESMAAELNQYRQGGETSLPEGGLERLQEAASRTISKPQRPQMPWRFASAAMLALAFFVSGFWMGRGSADQPLTTALHLPLEFSPEKDLPDLIRPPFTVALAESIPAVFSYSGAIPR